MFYSPNAKIAKWLHFNGFIRPTGNLTLNPMKKLIFLFALPALLAMLSFKTEAPKLLTGTYGVCSCGGTQSTSKVELTLNEDKTFHYFDNTNPSKAVDIKGSWVLSGNTVILKDYQSAFPIHTKWRVDKNGKCLKSRKGLEFTRLCHI